MHYEKIFEKFWALFCIYLLTGTSILGSRFASSSFIFNLFSFTNGLLYGASLLFPNMMIIELTGAEKLEHSYAIFCGSYGISRTFGPETIGMILASDIM